MKLKVNENKIAINNLAVNKISIKDKIEFDGEKSMG